LIEPSKLHKRVAAASLTTVVLALGLVVPGLAVGSASTASQSTAVPTSTAVSTIDIKMVKGKMGFFGPKTVNQGEELRIVNQTTPQMVGPHTFALVTKGSLPKTPKARQLCFTKGHICLAIAKWLGFNQKEEVTINPAEAGAEGWDTMGSVTKKGDAWFTGTKPGTSFEQVVSAAPGTTLYFMCAIHPWMQGSIKVLPASS
jgi:hypothetical protein